MQVHSAERLFRSLQRHLLLILTVAAGLLVALAIQALVLGYREYKRAEETRRFLLAELVDSKMKLIADLTETHDASLAIEHLTAFAHALRTDRGAAAPPDKLERSFAALPSVNWDAAVATGAIATLPYREARSYATAYQAARDYMNMESEAKRSWLELASFAPDYRSLSDAEIAAMERQLKISAAYSLGVQASGVALLQKIDDALRGAGH
jgi:hypothetical protein